MRLVKFAVVLVSLSLLAESSGASSRDVFEQGDYVLVRGRLAKCLSEGEHPIALVVVPDGGLVRLIGLPSISVLGRTPGAVAAELRDLYRVALPDRPVPPIDVELLRGKANASGVVPWHRMIRYLRGRTECYSVPRWEFPDQPPGIADMIDELASQAQPATKPSQRATTLKTENPRNSP